MDSAESSYWDQYGDEDNIVSSPYLPQQQFVSSLDCNNCASLSSVSSRDSYWSKYECNSHPGTGSNATGDGSDGGTPLHKDSKINSTSVHRRMLVMPDKLAALRLTALNDDDQLKKQRQKQISARSSRGKLAKDVHSSTSAPRVDTKTTASYYRNAQSDGVAVDCKDNGGGTLHEGVNALALTTRLNFLKDQMEQDERLVLNSVV